MKDNKEKFKETESKSTSIAVIGVACMFPKADNLSAYWANIKNKVDAITEVPPTHWDIKDFFDQDPKRSDHTYSSRGGFLNKVDFNPQEFGITPNSLESTDTSQLLGLLVAQQALQDAGYGDDLKVRRDKTSVILGVTGTQELVIPLGARLGHPLWRKALKEAGIENSVAENVINKISDSYVDWQESSFPGLLGNVAAGRIANRLNLRGTNCVVDAACASSLSALHLAMMELNTGRSNMVVTGGIDTFNNIFMYMCFSKTPVLSPGGDAKPFDHKEDGTVLGEGLGVLVLKRLSDAEKDHDNIYAVIRGMGTSSDGKGNAIYVPSSSGQKRALLQAYREAHISPDTVELVEAHGTGTKVGDATEVKALIDVFSNSNQKKPWCALGSVKSQIGHTKAAAGIAGLIKSIMALNHKVLPPTIKIEQPIKEVSSTSTVPFYLNTEKRPWIAKDEHPRRAAVSAFGFGGSNFHCIVEEYSREKKKIEWERNIEIIAFSAKSLEKLTSQLKTFPENLSWEKLMVLAAESRNTFSSDHSYRLLQVIDGEHTNIDQKLKNVLSILEKSGGKNKWNKDGTYFSSGGKPGKLAMVFPGQGAQYVGMFRDLSCMFPQFLTVLKEGNNFYSKKSNESQSLFGESKNLLSDYIYPVPVFNKKDKDINGKKIQDTEIAQPAIGVVSLGVLNILNYFSIKPEAVAGHSYGELTALCAASRIDEKTLHQLSCLRGQLMRGGNKTRGAMLAVQSDVITANRFITENKLDLVIANKNAPSQIVLSGAETEIIKAAEALSELKIAHKQLQVSNAFHSKFVSGVKKTFLTALNNIEFKTSSIPVFANTTSVEYPEKSDDLREILSGQLANPVEFVAQIQNMYKKGIGTFLEVGPGNKLSGLIKLILTNKEVNILASDLSTGRRNGIYDLASTLAHISSLGYKVDISKWNKELLPSIFNRKEKKAGLSFSICGANYKNKEHKNKQSANIRPNEPMSKIKTRQPELSQALQITQQNMIALQKIQEQTANLHQKFLEGQEKSQQAMLELINQQKLFFPINLPLEPITPVNNLPSMNLDKPEKVVLPYNNLKDTKFQEHKPPKQELQKTQSENNFIKDTLLEIVSEKTGYPKETIDMNMTMDSDLGIDSIKQVEILSALQEKLPHAPEVKPENMGQLQTLNQLSDFLENNDNVIQENELSNFNIEGVLLGVVSEKTGYPEDSLDMDMALDSDLGIDSIKQVEILSAIQEKLPQSPEIKPEQMGELRTLRQLSLFLSNNTEGKKTVGLKPILEEGHKKENSSYGKPKIEQSEKDIKRSVLQSYELNGKYKHNFSFLEQKSEIWITYDNTELSLEVEKALSKLGYCPRLISLTVPLQTELPESLGGLIVIAPLKGINESFLKKTFNLLQSTGEGLRKAGKYKGAIFVTISRLDGSFGLNGMSPQYNPISGGLAGFPKTVQHEWPEVKCKALDLSMEFYDPKKAALSIVEEIFKDGPIEIGISTNKRYSLKLSSNPLINKNHEEPLREGDVVVITGGARGVTAEVSIALAKAFKPTLVLLGRSQLSNLEPQWLTGLTAEADIKKAIIENLNKKVTPVEIEKQFRLISTNREILKNLKRIKSTGTNVVYRSVDIRNKETLEEVIKTIRTQYGPIRGLIHGAGVLCDRRIEDKTNEQFEMVFSTKVDGLFSLLYLTKDEDLKIMVMFSSVTGRYGRTGQIDYAVANEVLNKVAQQQARMLPFCRVVSVNWGPWDGGMVTKSLRKLFKNEGLELIPPEIGAKYLIKEISAKPGRHIEVVVLGDNQTSQHKKNEINQSIFPEKNKITKPIAFECSLDTLTHSFLQSHVINGRAVLPMAMIIEWMAHGAIHLNPGMIFHGFDNLRIFKGIIIDNHKSLKVQVRAEKGSKKDNFFIVPVEIVSGSEVQKPVIHASADFVLVSKLPENRNYLEVKHFKTYTSEQSKIYQDFLFHGPDFQGIEKIYGCSSEGIAAKVKSAPNPSQWMANPLRNNWLSEPLILDCSFQMMIIWSIEKYQKASLPCFAGRYRQYQSKFPDVGAQIIVNVTKSSQNRAFANIDYIDRNGKAIARLEDYECTIDQALKSTFLKNQLVVKSCSG